MGRDEQVPVFCPLCVSKCGATATIRDGQFVELGPDPSHPTGDAICTKGKAAPELVNHPDRLEHPLRRTAPKGAADPGWERISWDEALDTVAERLSGLARDHGPESVLFSSASPSTSAMSDSVDWLDRLRRAYGSPNLTAYMELCGWGRYLASLYTFGASVPGVYMPDLERAGAILYWGYNPSVSRLVHATETVAAKRRGAKLVAVDPRRVGTARQADHWLRVRPGTDTALALAMTHVMIDRGWFDESFLRTWTNAPLLVRDDTGRFLRADAVGGDAAHHLAWDDDAGRPVAWNPVDGRYDVNPSRLALAGAVEVDTPDGPVACRPVFDLLAEQCRQMAPAIAEDVTGVPAAEIEDAVRTLWESRPVAFYTWSGLEQHSTTTQAIRAINVLYALTGCLDAPGGNVAFTPVPSNPIAGMDLLPPEQRGRTIGVQDRPLGPGRFEFATGEDFYTAALEGRPYRARGLVSFGANLVMANGDSARGRDALASLDFHVHADMFMNPTAELADIVLPVTSAFESEALRIGFEVSQQATSRVQLRTPVAAPRGEARSDLRVIFDLAVRLGLGEHFWDGDIDAAWRHQLEPSGITLEQLRDDPSGVDLRQETAFRKYAQPRSTDNGDTPVGFATPTRLIELYSEVLLDHGYPALPTFDEPTVSPRSRPDLAEEFPLVLTCTKSLHFCETQHRNLPRLRSRQPDPEVELHPDTAAARGIAKGDWVEIRTPMGRVRARAVLERSLDPDVVCGQHGWWQGSDELDLPGFAPFGPDSANLNLVLPQSPSDPISGSAPLRSYVCEVAPLVPA
jgi:anaerobic selenocysteine-containing dehydrogenase